MKRIELICIVSFFALISTTVMSCGSDNDEEGKQVVVDTEMEAHIRSLCNLLNVNRDDYYECWRMYEIDGKIVFASLRKDNVLFAGVCNSEFTDIIYLSHNISIDITITGSYYENTTDYQFTGFGVAYGETDNGLIMAVNVEYRPDDGNGYLTRPYLIFYNGISSKTEQYPENGHINIHKWYNNSCLMRIYKDYGVNPDELFALTDTGNELFRYDVADDSFDIWGISEDDMYHLSDTDILQFIYDSTDKELLIRRGLVSPSQSVVWEKYINIFNDMPASTKVTYTITKREENIWTVVCYGISIDGKTATATIQLNIDTGDYEI